jgi:hypothetical protein
MSRIPIVETRRHTLTSREQSRCEEVAEDLQRAHPALVPEDALRPFMCEHLEDGPTLHLDDLSGIVLFDETRRIHFQQERGRLRAGAGDLMASCAFTPGYEDYCHDRLALGSVEWLIPKEPGDAHQIAAACWQDVDVRQALMKAGRENDLRYLHPHLGTRPVWELAGLISKFCGRTLQVIAPPPALTEWVNNKLHIASLAEKMFGAHAIPRSMRVSNLAKAAEYIRDLIEECSVITIKLPHSVGGGGILQIDAADCTGLSLAEIHEHLQQRFEGLNWDGECELLIGIWETQVCRAPSAQLWIPPEADGAPIVEGLFDQEFDGEAQGAFVGTRPADLPQDLAQEITNKCWQLGRVFQRCGYVGRCSFDTMIVGESEESAQLKFLECNGRWGAASLPMTLMNRLFGDWRNLPFAVRDVNADGLDRLKFNELVSALEYDLYDAGTGRGSLILINPARMQARSSITVLAVGESQSYAAELLNEYLPRRLQELVNAAVPKPLGDGPFPGLPPSVDLSSVS